MNDKRPKLIIVAAAFYGIDTSIRAAFEWHGFEASLVDYRVKANLVERLFGKTRRLVPAARSASDAVIRFYLERENRKLVDWVRQLRPDFVFVVKGEFLLPETVDYLRSKLHVPCISYQWDDPFLSSQAHAGFDRFRRANFEKSMGLFDHIFVFDTYYEAKIRERGIQHVSYLPLATDEQVYQKAELTPQEATTYACDLSFVGSPYGNRIELMNGLAEYDLRVYGDGWEGKLPELTRNYYAGKASGEKVRKIYAASKIVLNLHHPQSVHGANARTFDIPACGAFELVDYKQGVEDLFRIGEEIVCFRDATELKAQVAYYLDRPAERTRIAAAGMKRVRAEHTWISRVATILQTLKGKKTTR